MPPVSYNARDAWYRSADWDEASQAEFAERLRRARPSNRIQYRRIKALALLDTRDRVRQMAARALLEENLAVPGLDAFERTVALTTLARHERVSGRLVGALRLLRDALAIGGPDGNGTSGEEEIELAEILLANGADADLLEAKSLLDRRASDPPLFVRSRYRLAVAQTRTCLALGDTSAAAGWAIAALDFAAAEHSGLRHDPELGLVDPPDVELAWLRDVANAGTATE